MKDMKGQKIAVWFSCGAASAVAAKKTIELYGESNDVIVVNTPVAEEDEDNRRFLRDVENWIGQKVEIAINPKFPDSSAVSVWTKRRFMASIHGAPCTLEIKKEARYLWEKTNKPDWHVLGFTYNERERHRIFVISERPNVIPVLIDLQITKGECFQIINRAGIELPRIYKQGYPNANCKGCPKATSPTYWNHVRVNDPDVFEQRATISRELGARLVRVKGQRIFLDELDPLATGRPMKNMKFECGVFCEVTN